MNLAVLPGNAMPRAFVAAALAGIALLVVLDPALAQSATFQPLETAGQSILSFLQGTFGVVVATLALMGTAAMWFGGRLHFASFIAVGIGIIIWFGAGSLVTMLKGG